MVAIRAVLVDLSGTLLVENAPLPGALTALRRLQQLQNISIRYVTNTTKESSASLLAKLQRLGFAIHQDHILTSLTAARKLVEQRNLRPLLFLEDDAMQEFDGVDQSDPNAVVVGLAPSCFHYDMLNKAYHILSRSPITPLIAIHKARYYATSSKNGVEHALGPGAFVVGLEYAAGKQAEVVGKPEAAFFRTALQDMQCSAGEAVMIGDDIVADIAGAKAVGMAAVLVKTGKYAAGDEGKLKTAEQPDFIAADITEAVAWIEQLVRP
ncbi:Haloacid dehalogenase-like hydrolase domain-containing protein 2 [Sorochytrium milnesiophthora]